MTPRDFCIWLQGYLENNGKPEYSVDFRNPIQRKLEQVDLNEVKINYTPGYLPFYSPTTPPSYPSYTWYVGDDPSVQGPTASS